MMVFSFQNRLLLLDPLAPLEETNVACTGNDAAAARLSLAPAAAAQLCLLDPPAAEAELLPACSVCLRAPVL
jgi:hypothetical protein